jgi:acetyl esterase/lipase
MSEAGRVTIEDGVVFGRAGAGGRQLRCDVFRPPVEVTEGRPAPAVLLVHGGGWAMGDRSQLRGYGVLLGRAGYVCVASEYRLTTEAPWPAQIHDVKAALRWMRASAESLGIDPQRIAVEGNSAGGHLALLAAGTVGVPAFEGDRGDPGVPTDVAAAIAVYPPTLLPGVPGELHPVVGAFHPTLDEAGTAAAAAASPVHHVSPSFPPTMLIHGSADELVPVRASFLMHDALVAAGVPVDLHVYAGQPHAFDAEPRFGRICAAEMLLFLDRYVRVPATA